MPFLDHSAPGSNSLWFFLIELKIERVRKALHLDNTDPWMVKVVDGWFWLHGFFLLIVLPAALVFDMDYARWLDEHQKLINDLRSAVNSHMGDNDLHLLVDGVMAHYDEIFRLKSIGARSDVFHMLSGMWKTPAERCFMWLGGFRSSELLKVIYYMIILVPYIIFPTLSG